MVAALAAPVVLVGGGDVGDGGTGVAVGGIDVSMSGVTVGVGIVLAKRWRKE